MLQGSVLGPLLFILYTADLTSLIENSGFSPHLYADDSQMYGSCRPVLVDTFSPKLSDCVGVISNWMRSNRLQLNSDKTEVFWCSTGRRQHHLPTTALLIDGVPRSTNNIGMLRCAPATSSDPQRSADTATFHSIVVALVMSRLDYRNGVLIGLPTYLVRRLQSVQNVAARLICSLRRFDHITDALVSLHWLRVQERVVYKIAGLTFKVLHGIAPAYL